MAKKISLPRLPILSLAISQTLGYAGLYYSFSALLGTWETELGWDKPVISLGLTIALIVAAITSPLIGHQIDRDKALPWMPLGMLLGALALVFLPFIQDPLGFYFLWALVGVGQGSSLYDPTFSVITKRMGDQATRAITTVTLVAGFASTIAFPLAYLLTQHFGWRQAIWGFAALLIFLGIPNLVFGLLGLKKLPQEKSKGQIATSQGGNPTQTIGASSERPVLGLQERSQSLSGTAKGFQSDFLLLLLAFPLAGLAQAMVITHILPIFQSFQVEETMAIFAAGSFGPMQVTGRLFFLRTGSQVNPLALGLISFGGILLALCLLPFVGNAVFWPLVFSIVFGTSFGMVSILKPVILAHVMGRGLFGKFNGILAVPMLLSFALAPSLAAFLQGFWGYGMVIVIGLSAAFMGLILLSILFLRQRSRERSAANLG